MTQNTDPTLHRTPTQAIMAAPESLAHVAASDPRDSQRGGRGAGLRQRVRNPGEIVGWAELCHRGHAGRLERRYLIAPGLRSSRTYISDTKRLTAHRGSAADASTTA